MLKESPTKIRSHGDTLMESNGQTGIGSRAYVLQTDWSNVFECIVE